MQENAIAITRNLASSGEFRKGCVALGGVDMAYEAMARHTTAVGVQVSRHALYVRACACATMKWGDNPLRNHVQLPALWVRVNS